MPDIRVAPAQTGEWVSAHVFHRGDLDGLLLTAVEPLVDELSRAGAIGSWFFLRYWEGGPHLRVRLRPATGAAAEEVRRAALERFGRHLRDNPAPPVPAGVLDAYRAVAERWARAERLDDYDRQVRTTDSVEFVTYHPEQSVYGERAALRAAESHFAESSALALRLLRAGLPAARLRAAGLGMLMLSLACCEPRSARAAERLRGRCSPPAATGDPGRLRAQARHLWAAVNGNAVPPLHGELATWTRSVRTLHERLVAASRDGTFMPTEGRSPLGHLGACAPPETRSVAIAVLRCTHLLFNRLGIHGAAELRIADLAAGALIDLNQER